MLRSALLVSLQSRLSALRAITASPTILESEPQYPHLPRAIYQQLEVWANAQRDGRPAEYRWRPLFNAAKFG